MSMPNCWDLLNCGREKNGANVGELGQCPASIKDYGHSCWGVAGTLCGGEVQGSAAKKKQTCMTCEVYKKYHHATGTDRKRLMGEHPDEIARYRALMSARLRNLADS